jgi:MerR family copper efflux transcriptional regulator
MNIGQAARASGVSAKMIRHYETIGLIPRAARSLAGYRHYGEADVQRLAFIRHARNVGFATGEIRELLSLWQNRRRSARDVKRLAAEHLAEIEARIAELQSIAATLAHLLAHCHGDARPECPILDALQVDPGPTVSRARGKAPPQRHRAPPPTVRLRK